MRENSEKSDFFIESYVKKNHMLMKSNSTRVMRSMITLKMSLFDTKLRVHRKYAMWTYALYIHMCFPVFDHSYIYVGEECSELIGKASNFDSVEGQCKVLLPCNLLPGSLVWDKGKIAFRLVSELLQNILAQCVLTIVPKNTNLKIIRWISCELRHREGVSCDERE